LIGLMLVARPVSRFALKFGPPEYFSLMVLGLLMLIYITQKSLTKSIIMAGFGALISFIGIDVITGQPRFTFDVNAIVEGIDILPIAMGIFGIGEVLLNLEDISKRTIYSKHIKGLLPTLKDWKESIGAILRGSLVGFLLGVLPGGGGVLASFVSYGIEKKISKEEKKFGHGVIQGVAAPESANNAAASSCFVPLMTLGIPTNPTTAILLGGLLIHGLTPGPVLLRDNPAFFWGVISSMYIGNVMLLVLNLPLIGLWVQVLKTPPRFLMPMIVLFCVIGVYSVNNSATDLGLMLFFGVFGYLARKLDYEPAPLMLAYVLGPMLERSLRQSLLMSEGNPLIFISRPISAVMIALAIILLGLQLLPSLKKKRATIVGPRQE
jgi:putative tricarboxylic transport membrane protein